MRVLALTVVFASILGSPKWSTAEINMADSIEWMTADADRVVVGRVTAVTERAGDVVWSYVTFAPTDALKGTVNQTVTLVVRGNAPTTWKSTNRELMLFLVDSNRRAKRDGDCATKRCDYDRAPFALQYNRQGDGVLSLDGNARAYTATFGVLAKRDELIAAVRNVASSRAKEALQLDAPLSSPAGKALWSGSSVWLYVPIDFALEQRAIGWITANDAHERDRGVLALSHFKSPANIKRLEALLVDTGTIDTSENGKPMIRRFFVRKRAHSTLTKWGVAHVTPVIDRQIPLTP